ncbi:MAG: uracil-DNA glycosylase [Salibacteraceae bacterium]
MEINLPSCWKQKLNSEVEKDYFKELIQFVNQEYKTETVFPEKANLFAAFGACKMADLKVVIIGQDPYHGKGQANGLCFSVNQGIANPPSLTNIFKEIKAEKIDVEDTNGDLSRWANQGVLLLNATLSVREGEAGSHQKMGWEKFTDAVIKVIDDNCNEVVFMLWGGYAKKKGKKVNRSKHLVLESGHPSPLSANRGYWFGNNHFVKCNQYLKEQGKSGIDWN